MKKLILGLAATAAVAVAAPGLASRRRQHQRTTNDAYGYCIANHIANFNGDHHGIGHLRSGHDRRSRSPPTPATAPRPIPASTPRVDYAPISNNG